MGLEERHHPPTPSSKEEGEKRFKAPSSSEEGVGGGGAAQSDALPRESAGGGVLLEALKVRARAMRNNPTEPEKRLWMALRDNRFAGFKFRRQDVIAQRIVDFFCPAKGLVIEVDGDTHDAEADATRDAQMLRDSGFATVRFTNAEVMRNLEGCLVRLRMMLDEQPERWAGRQHHPPTPSSKEEGEK